MKAGTEAFKIVTYTFAERALAFLAGVSNPGGCRVMIT